MSAKKLAEYPIHDKDGYLEFMLGMWHNTREISGKPSTQEVLDSTREWPNKRRIQLVEILAKHNQLAGL